MGSTRLEARGLGGFGAKLGPGMVRSSGGKDDAQENIRTQARGPILRPFRNHV